MWSFLVNMMLLELPALVIILSVVGTAVLRAFASSRADGIDVFLRRDRASEPPSTTSVDQADLV
jgi:hypothetical protein